MKVLIAITSYNRKEMLLNIINNLADVDIIVYDDNSDFTLNNGVKFVKFPVNYGKKRAWEKFDIIFKDLKEKDYDYYFIIPDDIDLCENFVEKSIKIYEGIEDKNKICLSLLSDKRVKNPNWTNFQPVDKGDVILTQWNDLCFICDKKFLNEVKMRPVPLSRWDVNKDLGSGVGSQISRDLTGQGFNMYHTKKSLVKHIGYKSQMNLYHKEI